MKTELSKLLWFKFYLRWFVSSVSNNIFHPKALKYSQSSSHNNVKYIKWKKVQGWWNALSCFNKFRKVDKRKKYATWKYFSKFYSFGVAGRSKENLLSLVNNKLCFCSLSWFMNQISVGLWYLKFHWWKCLVTKLSRVMSTWLMLDCWLSLTTSWELLTPVLATYIVELYKIICIILFWFPLLTSHNYNQISLYIFLLSLFGHLYIFYFVFWFCFFNIFIYVFYTVWPSFVFYPVLTLFTSI